MTNYSDDGERKSLLSQAPKKRYSLVDVEHVLKTGSLAGTELDPTKRGSLVNVLHHQAKKTLDEMDVNLLGKDENQLEMIANPSPAMNRLRIVFWRHFEKSKNMTYPEIDYERVCHESSITLTAMYKAFTNPKMLAWIMCPVVNYQEMMGEVYRKAITKMREALDVSLVDANNQLDSKALREVIRIYELLDKRQFGEFVQKVDVTNRLEAHTTFTHLNDEHNAIDVELKRLEDAIKNNEPIEFLTGDEENEEVVEESSNDEDEQQRVQAQGRERGLKIKATKA